MTSKRYCKSAKANKDANDTKVICSIPSFRKTFNRTQSTGERYGEINFSGRNKKTNLNIRCGSFLNLNISFRHKLDYYLYKKMLLNTCRLL